MKTALEKILEYKVKDGRITSQSDKEQWTCLQKIIAINKLIVDYHNAFVELRESYQDLLDRYNVINAEWDVLKTDMEAIASEWTQFKPLVNQIINLWENTITPTFEEWTTLMNNWGNTMNGYASTMADYEQQMNNIQQEFNNIETEWGNITLAVKGNFEFITEAVPASESTTLTVNLTEFNEMYIVGTQDDKIDVSLLIGEVMIPAYNGIALKKTSYVGFKYIGDIDNGNQLYRMYGTPITSEYFSITDSNDTTATFTITNRTNTTRIYAILRRHIPYFSADQSSEVQEALTKSNGAETKANEAITKANEADTKATNAQSSATSAMQSAQSALTNCGQLESGKMSNKIINCITSDMSTLSETRSYTLKAGDPNMFVYVEGIPNTDSGHLCCTIPLSSIPKTTGTGTGGGRRYQLTDETNYFSFTLAFNDITKTLYITFSTRAKNGAKITRVALYG